MKGSMSNYLNLEVISAKRETEDTISLILKEKSGKEVSFTPGQFLTFIFDYEGGEVRRGYSICTSPNQLPEMGVAIKRVGEGFTSDYLFDKLKEGEVFQSVPPLGNFTIETDPNTKREMVLFGAGSGITPLMSMLKAVLENEPESKVTLIYGNRNEDSIIFRDELNELEEKYGNRFKVYYTLSRPSDEWKGHTGRITIDKTRQLYKDISPSEDAHYYLCGPEGMMLNVIDALKENGVAKDHIHREIYSTTVVDDEDVDDETYEVTIIFGDKKKKVTVPPDKSILECALDEGFDLPNSCQFGICGTCRAKLLSGKLKLVDQTALSEEELEQGYCLTCVGHPASDNVVILYEDQFI